MEPRLTLRPSSVALTEITASEPTEEERAVHVLPLRTSEPLEIVALMELMGTPGAEMLIGLSIPAYSTFIIVGEMVAIGSMTVYVDLKGNLLNVPSCFATSMYPEYVCSPRPLAEKRYLPCGISRPPTYTRGLGVESTAASTMSASYCPPDITIVVWGIT